MAEGEILRVTQDGPVAVCELADPTTGNALSGRLVESLTATFTGLARGASRAVVLTGQGRHFCAGAHLGEMARLAAGDDSASLADAERLAALYAAVLRCPLVTLAAVHGAAFGGGLGLAAACDLVIAAPNARMQLSEVRLGFVPALISVFLPRRLPLARLAELALDPEPLDGRAAAALRIVDEVADDPVARAVERAGEIAAKAAPSAVAATKRLLLELHLPRLDEQLSHAARVNAAQRSHPECRRGVAHFLATKEFPDWDGID